MSIYLSYPMTGMPGHGIPHAIKIAELLRKEGYDLVVPHEIMHGDGTHLNASYSHADYIRGDVKHGMLADGVDSIALMDGWPHSKGCMIEFNLAVGMGYRVYQVIEFTGVADLLSLDGKGGW